MKPKIFNLDLAPKDGTYVLLSIPKGSGFGSCDFELGYFDEGEWRSNEDWSFIINPIGWSYLPE